MLYIAEICAIATNATVAADDEDDRRLEHVGEPLQAGTSARARRTSAALSSCASSEPVLSPTRIIWRAAGGKMPDAWIGRARPSPRIIASRTVASFVLEHAVVRAVGRHLHRVGQRHAGVHERREHAAEPLDRDRGASSAPIAGSEQQRVAPRLAALAAEHREADERRAPTTTARISHHQFDMKSVKPSSIRVGSGSFASRLV